MPSGSLSDEVPDECCGDLLAMNEILATVCQRFTKGLREAPYQFVEPIIVVARKIRLGLSTTPRLLGTAATSARKWASRPKVKHK